MAILDSGVAADARRLQSPAHRLGPGVVAMLAAPARRGVVLAARASSTRKTSTAPITPVTMPARTSPRIALLTAYPTPKRTADDRHVAAAHSHSIVPGGLDVMSSTTRLTSRISPIMREAICSSRSYGSRAQSAVIASSDVTARIATT